MEELALHILDIARNSIEAGAAKIEIRVRESAREDLISFSVLDNGPGLERDLLTKITDPFYTTKNKKKKVGLGLALLKAAAEWCDGSFQIQTGPGQGTKVTAAFRHGHIDRAPLGDLPGTITVLLTEPALADLVYSHEVDGKRFFFSLQSLKDKCG